MTTTVRTYADELGAPSADCCDLGAMATDAVSLRTPSSREAAEDLADPSAFVHEDTDGTRHLHLFVDGLHCAGCIRKIEGGLLSLRGIDATRVNMSTGRLAVSWRDADLKPARIVNTVQSLGYGVAPFDPEGIRDHTDTTDRFLLSSLAVAGFAAANVMLLSVSIWAGAVSDMGPATRDMFHWISAAIALPAVAFAGRPFFYSAFGALRGSRMNMDVPISLAVILAAVMSLHQTMMGREHAYFDAAISLLFFLLIGRYLDHRARTKARSTATHLLGLTAANATVIDPDGQHRLLPARSVPVGAHVHVAAGERVPVDGIILSGVSSLDSSLVTGETVPAEIAEGAQLFAGTMNLTAPVVIRATASGEDTLLAEIVRLVETTEQDRTKYVQIADKAARIYAPAVHILALVAFVGWWSFIGAGLETSIMVAVAVLIITCPCALGLAVPAVQVVATGVLLRAGILIKSKDGLERLAEIDTVVFDKTGTLTVGRPELVRDETIDQTRLERASALAIHSTHPMSKAVVRTFPSPRMNASDIEERPGFGLSGKIDGKSIRLGNAAWCGTDGSENDGSEFLELWLAEEGQSPVRFRFSDRLRPDAREAVTALQEMGLRLELLSGDRPAIVNEVAQRTGIDAWQGQCLPTAKCERLDRLSARGRKVLMIGDGLNDAPALAAGHASISPASGAEISQAAADFVFQGEKLSAVVTALKVARVSNRLVRQNIGLAVVYNVIAVPIAVAGLVTPLIAAVAMSTSSIVVTLNAMRLKLFRGN